MDQMLEAVSDMAYTAQVVEELQRSESAEILKVRGCPQCIEVYGAGSVCCRQMVKLWFIQPAEG